MSSEFERAPAMPSGDAVVVKAKVPADLRYLAGHFPGRPIVPGVAQLIGLVLEPAREVWPDLGEPSAIRRLKFLEALAPGDALEIELAREEGRLRFEIRREGVRCTVGSFSLRPRCES